MNRFWLIVMLGLMLNGCTSSTDGARDMNNLEEAVQFIVDTKHDMPYEFPFMGDSLFSSLPEESSTKLGSILMDMGFEEFKEGRGNYPPRGPRLVTRRYKRTDCECYVLIIYYFTVADNLYEISERISCKAADT